MPASTPSQSAPPASLTASIAERFVTLPGLGVTTRLLEAGAEAAGRPVALLLHGNPDNAEQWIPVMSRLGATHRCVAPDIPGYGKSPEPPANFDYSLQAQVAFVDELLSVLGVNERILLIVHDIGGTMGIAWAGARTARLAALLINNTVAFDGFEWFAIAKTWGRESVIGRLRARAGLFVLSLGGGKLFKKVFWAQSPQLAEEQIDRVVHTFILNPAAKSATLRQFRRMVRPGFFKGFAEILERVTRAVPTLVLWGDRDPYVSVEWARHFAHARVVVLPEAGHWVALTEPQRLVDEARRLVAQDSIP
jgi:pimeloyl-ACP methyl ester carboxylesterase